uniref:Uncharacterized protein n=1 Tax=Panagrolaimus davidi TaxID=227884 RepID=A0A914Q1V4_9BILA
MAETVHRPLQSGCNSGGESVRKDYGSSKAYADEVRNWVGLTQMWMMEQQRNMLQNMRPMFPVVPQGQMVNFQQQNIGVPAGIAGRNGIARRIMFRIGLNGNGFEPQFQTIIQQEYQIPSFAKRFWYTF